MMNLTSFGITNNVIEGRFGKFGIEKLEGVPTLSLPVSWSNIPERTKSIALVMQDCDAVPVCGFSWVHWLVADIDPAFGGLPENASRIDKTLIQGKNSLASKQICGDLPDEITCFYGGPRPPDKDHEYEVRVFALDTVLGLNKGFRYNELVRAMRGHVLDEGVLYGWYPAN
ncbi:YbhB/YbcL family Raf kinase inhibitor-like protein [Candidatus Gracilibacteria bacterium]|nr:YbhB/YbcL family Raf kinase inhibitor-like protein [Candidatus Gracilibacteria bacterium]